MDDFRTVKCVIIGDRDVGKKSLLHSYMENGHEDEYDITPDNSLIHVDGQTVNLWFLNTWGLNEFFLRQLLYRHYIKPDVIILCFSLVDPRSFVNVKNEWYDKVLQSSPNALAPIVLVGLKGDLRESTSKLVNEFLSENGSTITFAKGMTMAEDIKAVKYVECSAITKTGINTVFEEATRAALAAPIPKPQPKMMKHKVRKRFSRCSIA